MRRALVLLCLLGPAVATAADLQIAHVYHEPAGFEPAAGQSLAVHFRISRPAAVTLHVHDGRDRRVRSVASEGVLAAGDHALVWDGADVTGRSVPPEAYVYTLEARGEDGAVVAWDLTDTTGGASLDVADLRWDSDARVVRYRLAEPGRVRIRIGLQEGGPLLRTLIDWVPRPAGAQEEPWDGLDAGGVLDLGRHPKLALFGQAFALSRNAVLVGPPPRKVVLLGGLPEPAVYRARRPMPRPGMFDYARHPIETRRDFPVRLVLPGAAEDRREEVPVVRGPAAVRVEVDPEHLTQVLDQRCEVVFFVDGHFAFESETGFLPMTWTWDPRGATPGPHYITVNLRGYEGYFGFTTVEVLVSEVTPPGT